MPKINFNDTRNAGPAPDGEYTCKIDHIERASTKRGDEMWKLRLVVQEGGFAGHVVFDNLPFTADAMPRVKALCEGLGLDTEGEVDLTPEMIEGRVLRVHVLVEEYQGVEKNKVAFLGYAPVDGESETW